MQFLQTLFAWAACGTLAALFLLCLAGRLKAHPPSPRAMRGVPAAALVALLALAAAVGSRAVPKSRAPAPGGRASPRAAMPGAGSAATPRVTAIDVGPAGVDLVLFRPEADSASAANVTVAACADLSARGNWFALAGAVFPAGETNVLVSIARAALDAAGIATPAFFSFGGSGDADGDGLADWHESLNAGTDPNSADTDGDLLPDGWELSHGLDPLRAIGADGALGDPDGDGLSNLEELRAGTDPAAADTDEDGIPDRDETGWIETTASLNLPYVVYGESIYIHYPPSGITGSGTFPFTLPFSVNLCGRTCSRGYADAHGVVRFVPDGDGPSAAYPALGDNQPIPCDALEGGISVAAWWDALHLRANVSGIFLTELTREGRRYAVVSYVSAYSADGECQSFGVILCEQEPNQVMVQYDAPHNNVRGLSATLGVQGPNGSARLQHSCNEPVSAGAGISLVYHLGVGTDPLRYDTDGDGMPDGWELSHGLLPHSADGDNGASGDPDGDGLSNWMEHVSGASPVNANSFSSGLGDLAWVLNGFGMPPAYGVEVSFSVGDPSPSHSERWLMRLRDVDEGGRRYMVACDGHGDVAEWTLRLERGKSYVGSIEHVSSSRDVPDFDWCAQVEGLPLTDVLSAGMVHSGAARWIVDYDKSLYIDNEHGLLGVCDPEFGETDATVGKTFTLHVVKTAVEPAAACSPAEWTGRREFALTGDSTQWADWTIEPSLTNGAKLYASAAGGEGADVVYGTSRVHVSSGSVATNYTVTARHPICAGSAASAEFTVFRIGVEAMRFNHDLASSAGDAVSIRANYDEVGFDPATGEWSRGGVTNFPACYRAGTMPTVQAKFTVEPKLTTNVTVFAQTTGDLFGLPGLLDATVALTNGASGWVSFRCVGRVFGQVARCAAGIDWHVCGLGPERLAPAKHAGTGPHRVYVVLGDLVEPWSGDLTSDQCAWTNALEWACGAAAGATTLSEAASLVTEGINMSGVFHYDTEDGASYFTKQRRHLIFWTITEVSITDCLSALNNPSANEYVNCTDCAAFVTSFSNLLGCGLYSSRMGLGFATNPYCAIGQPAWTPPSWGWGFNYHEVAWDGDAGDGDLVYDACLRYDGDDDPTSEPHVSQLPVAVQFSDGNPAPPLVYRERLTPNAAYGYPYCGSIPSAKIRRLVR